MLQLISALIGPFGILLTIFWVWMIYDCLKNERDRQTWLWILIFLNVIGACLYFFMCWMPRASIPLPHFARRWTRQDALWQAEAEAKNIGKAHQFIKLGNLLSDIGERGKAANAYLEALVKEPENPKALWGIALIEMEQKHWNVAEPYLKTLIKVQPDFAYGDASFSYGQVLFNTGNLESAQAHFQEHFQRWSHPEAYLLMAKIQQQLGQSYDARETLETMIIKVKSSPPFQYRRNKKYVGQGERMLRTLGG
jgi:hypothetical protein